MVICGANSARPALGSINAGTPLTDRFIPFTDPQGHAAACLAVARVAATEMAKGRSATNPSSKSAVGLYNRAVADLAADLPALIRQQGNAGAFTLRDPQSGETARLQVASRQAGEYPAGFFQQILVASRIDKKGLKDDVTRGGVGGAVVGVRQSSPPGAAPPRLEPQKVFCVPVTAVVDLSGAKRAPDAQLRLLDPAKVDSDQGGHTRQPLAADYSAAMASYGRINETWIGLVNMVRGERMRGPKGLQLLQPYDPDKLPVIFVHGLLSSAYTWRNLANSLMPTRNSAAAASSGALPIRPATRSSTRRCSCATTLPTRSKPTGLSKWS